MTFPYNTCMHKTLKKNRWCTHPNHQNKNLEKHYQCSSAPRPHRGLNSALVCFVPNPETPKIEILKTFPQADKSEGVYKKGQSRVKTDVNHCATLIKSS
ncbi:hypothetical protein NEUTE1DRAFT_116332, partial [Neurospora tetrasperma FGSC 2508]